MGIIFCGTYCLGTDEYIATQADTLSLALAAPFARVRASMDLKQEVHV